MKRLFLISFLAINIFAAYAQSFILHGKVIDEATNETLAGVTVLIKGTTIETVTDLDGWFALKVPDITKHKIIVFSYAGYKKQEYTINMAKNDIRITMTKEEVVQKTEIVVVKDDYVRTDDMASISVDADIASSSREEDVYLEEVFAVAYASEKGKGYTGSSSAIYGSRSASEDVKIRGTATKSPPAKPAPPPPTSTSDYRVATTSSSPYSNIKSGTLTAGEVNDFAKWHLWGDILKKDFISY